MTHGIFSASQSLNISTTPHKCILIILKEWNEGRRNGLWNGIEGNLRIKPGIAGVSPRTNNMIGPFFQISPELPLICLHQLIKLDKFVDTLTFKFPKPVICSVCSRKADTEVVSLPLNGRGCQNSHSIIIHLNKHEPAATLNEELNKNFISYRVTPKPPNFFQGRCLVAGLAYSPLPSTPLGQTVAIGSPRKSLSQSEG